MQEFEEENSLQIVFKEAGNGNPLVVQWLGLSAFTAMAQVRSLIRELRSCKP